MKRVVFATAMAMIVLSGTSIAAPIAPLPTTVTSNADNVIQAHYYHGHYYPYYHHHHYYHHRYWRHRHWYYW